MQRFPFNTLPKGPLSFVVTMDGAPYSASVTWNIQGRWYLTLTDRFGNRVTTVAVVESPPFSTLAGASWDGVAQRLTLTTALPHGFRLGSMVVQTVRGATPDALNGQWAMRVDSPTTLSFPMVSDPGAISAPGSYGRDVDLTAGYFMSSVLVYRAETFFAYP